MNPLHLRLRNVGTWADLDLDLPEGILALTGGNGAGKSTIVNAIEAALFGPEGRSFEALYPRGNGTDALMIELVFEHGGEQYRVRRSYSPKGRGVSKTDLERFGSDAERWALDEAWLPLTLESQTETQAMIEKLIGITRDTFRASSFVRQTEVGRFCEVTAGKRKAILADALGLEEWERWLAFARGEKRTHEADLAAVAGQLQQAVEEVAEREAIERERLDAVENVRLHEEGVREATAAALSARDALAQLGERAARRTELAEAETRAQRLLEHLEGTISRNEEEIVALDTRLAQRDSLAKEAKRLRPLQAQRDSTRQQALQWDEAQRLRTERDSRAGVQIDLIARAEALQQRATAVLDAIGSETCDRCGQVLNEDAAIRAAESYRADAAKLNEEIDAITLHLGVIAAALRDMPTEAPPAEVTRSLDDEIARCEQAQRALAALEEAERRRGQSMEELHRMRAELPEREAAVAAAKEALAALGPHDPTTDDRIRGAAGRTAQTERDLRDRLDILKALVARHDERLERLDRVEVRRLELVSDRSIIQGALDLAIAMETACGANGVPALIMENMAIPQLEVEATRILGMLGGPAYAVELRSQRETKAGGISDTLDVMLLTDDGEAPFEAFSGGERAAIAFALRLALAQLLAARRGSATGILVIDEIEGLDANRIAALVTVLEGLQQSIPRILVVSHQVELRDAFEQSLALENVGGRSRIAGAVNEVRA